ncbi:CapA family protein [Sinomonas sp. JGH33]|uniref:CapA family protein n=1 Tax=Sinomonas terricola TaxID=3110330 RepID=A0ABU5T9C0_9MICC|nr:CapA family protein [Sinomonas sp. JGH33]MEA5456173.1 CapA family protein [Sinomonas sp. JGH33]
MKICLVGDVMLGRLLNERLRHSPPERVWGDLLPLFEEADLRFANLECVLADGGTPWPDKAFHFRSDTKNVACLEKARIDVVSLANNHTLDYGVGALREMLPVLDARGVLHAGAGLDAEGARRPAVVTAGAVDVGVIAFTDNEPGWAATEATAGVFHVPTSPGDPRLRDLVDLVRRTRSEVGFLVVSAHWGANWGTSVPADHRAVAHALVDAGADVVFGHSAHIFRGVEVYHGRPVVYSAGDFVDDYAVDPLQRNDESFAFVLEAHDGVPVALRLVPTLIEDLQVRLAGREARAIGARMQRLSAALGTEARWLDAERRLDIRCGSGS